MKSVTSTSSVGDADARPISTLDGILQEFSRTSDTERQVSRSSEAHEGLHSNKASSLSNLMSEETDSITLGVSSDLEILSTSAPPSSRGGQLIGLRSTGIQHNGTGLLSGIPQAPIRSTSSAVSDNVFDTQSDSEEVKRKDDDDVFSSEMENEGKAEVDSERVDRVEENSTYAKLMAEQRRKSEELKLKG